LEAHVKHNGITRQSRTTLAILTGVVLAGSTAVCASIVMAASVADPARGRVAFEKQCTGCHDLDKIKVGPPLRGIYGRPAGKYPHFPYSEALKRTSATWDESTLERWLTDTDSVIPDNDMAFRLNDSASRANIIAYLRQVSGK
jgi:cytochrome c